MRQWEWRTYLAADEPPPRKPPPQRHAKNSTYGAEHLDLGACPLVDLSVRRRGAAMMAGRYAHAKQVLAGLTRRRKREWSMIESGDYGVEGEDHKPTVITRNEDGSGPLVGAPVTAASAVAWS